ncbi:MAG: nuclear transport factor 2 family protein [Anaerolineales bacterium]|nr:nuclear transport factor 2 family protein [Dehalococcoidia bacterium]MCB0021038.1 nuclear transport factor 2 family protein [Anaerolineales bacterium]MCB9486997.1 nuclear transport factor 2 family protein [Thermoflexaceae bacterium]
MQLTADDHAEIHRLYGQYSQAIDLGSPDAFADVFTHDAVLKTEMGDYTGREALKGFATWFRGQMGNSVRHWPANLVVGAEADLITATCYFGAFQVGDPAGPKPIASGIYSDVLAKTGDGWKIASRNIAMDKPG